MRRKNAPTPPPQAPVERASKQRPTCDRCRNTIGLYETYQHPPGESGVWAHVKCLQPELDRLAKQLPRKEKSHG